MEAESLIEKAKTGEQSAFTQLTQLWYPKIYNFCFKYFGSEEEAQESTQKTFISMYQHFYQLTDNQKFKQWLYRIALNICHNEKKAIKRREAQIAKLNHGSNEDGVIEYEIKDTQTRTSPQEIYANQEQVQILQWALSQINKDQKEVIIMKEYEGLKFSEIAEILQISENTAKARLYQGLKALHKIMISNNLDKESLYYGL